MQVLKIIDETMADGPGLRTSVYVAGCNHKCPGCHNPESWEFNQGEYWDPVELAKELIKNPYTNITFSGGDPLYQVGDLAECCKYIKENSNKNIWVYTGFFLEQVLEMPLFKKTHTVLCLCSCYF
jgi:anaerobic ribonucleoside-triphosphate reductase activating protein